MKKLKDEKILLKQALVVGVKYAEARGAATFEESDAVSLKVEFIYRLLVRDKLIQPVPEDQISQQTMKHKLALWMSKQNTAAS